MANLLDLANVAAILEIPDIHLNDANLLDDTDSGLNASSQHETISSSSSQAEFEEPQQPLQHGVQAQGISIGYEM